MKRTDLVLAALSPAGTATYTATQVQKLLFLIDRNIAASTGGPHFEFEPHHYGPLDLALYHELGSLESADAVIMTEPKGLGARSYRLTDAGMKQGEQVLVSLPPDAQRYIHDAVEFVRSLPFAELVGAINKAYPEMAVNSVFAQARA